MAVQKISQSEFDTLVLKNEGTVLVDFYADWCGPCRMLSPVVEQASQQAEDITFCKINVDEAMDVAARYGISSIPALLVFRGGELLRRSVGVVPLGKVLELIGK